MNTPLQEKVANVLSGAPIAASMGMSLGEFNIMLETATLVLGFVAGAFAMFFHIRRYLRSRARDRQGK